MLREDECYITQFTTSTPGFTGILKHRYNDFQVLEVDLQGRVAHLTADAAAPDAAKSSREAEELPLDDQAPHATTPAAAAAAVQHITSLAGADSGAVVGSLLARALLLHSNPRLGCPPQPKRQVPAAAAQEEEAAQHTEQQQVGQETPPPASSEQAQEQQQQQQEQQQQPAAEDDLLLVGTSPLPNACEGDHVLLQPLTDRSTRKALHEYLKALQLPPRQALFTDTVAGEDGAFNIIRVNLGKAEPLSRRNNAGRGGWQGGGGGKGYVRFVMFKENMDTHAALNVVGRMLQAAPGRFGFAGTKDKRGATCQYITLFKGVPERLEKLNHKLRGIKLGAFEHVSDQLSLGQLAGNQFKVLMRGVSAPRQQVAEACEQLRQRGFINYYGLQRFGTGGTPTQAVGAALLRGDWEDAVALIMAPSEGERDDVAAARRAWTVGKDPKVALRQMPTWLTAERSIMTALSKQRPMNNYPAALLTIPRTLRMMYLHAWQSALWNAAASARVKHYGFDRVVAGDLVLPPAAAAAAAGAGSGSSGGGGMLAGGGEVESAGEQLSGAALNLASVHLVTEEEAAAGVYSMRDVVLPLPGSKVQYPLHAAGWPLYESLAGQDGIQLPGGPTPGEAAAGAMAEAGGTGTGEAAAAPAAAAAAGKGDDSKPGAASDPSSSGAAAASNGAPVAAPKQPHRVKEFSLDHLTGDYRRLLHVPSDLEYSFLQYSDPDAPLVPNEWDLLQAQHQQQQQQKREKQQQRQKGLKQEEQQQQHDQQQQDQHMKGQKRQRSQPELAGEGGQQQMEEGPGSAAGSEVGALEGSDAALPAKRSRTEGGDVAAAAGVLGEEAMAAAAAQGGSSAAAGEAGPGGPLTAVLLQFQLPSSCYATMTIRELTKESTSKEHYKAMTNATAAAAAGGGQGEKDAAAAEVPGSEQQAMEVADG